MNDKEMLEFAGKAMGWIDYPTDSVEQGSVWHCDPDKAPFGPVIPKHMWKPLDSDGEILRIAVKLNIDIEFGDQLVWARCNDKEMVCEIYSHHNNDAMSATRHAVFRAAAEIGRTMK